MTIDTLHTDEARWQAVLDRDAKADGQFVFAVLTTGIFCRPSCRARHALRQNVRFFSDASAALAGGFRPCKRCQPDALSPEQQKIAKVAHACRLLEQDSPVTLDALAQAVAVSPYHFHRMFKSITGVTPKAWQQAWRANRLRDALSEGEPVTQAVLAAGFPSSSSYYRHADALLGMTARTRRRGGEATEIHYTVGKCSLGRCLVALSERGVCAVLLGDDEASLLSELQQSFPAARLLVAGAEVRETTSAVMASLESRAAAMSLPLDIRGTAFQQQVWQALRAIPFGETRSYQQVAEAIGKPKAVRAVASACAANRLAILVPCHRVVRGDGSLSGYRWGVARKARLLAREKEQESEC
ncbi:TPA: bifunctional DNA-binding transcriptional regulator/O6-methylguanine-DNA methyltransferase Ada [Kluyvera ascorbata]|uniref:bifunctional DNA-binding transcriptional regulator/O6-methylguanine-DNA methyltransferase Ada n=1 Tax=Kluyvera TaxID=579 RepID=UPI001CC1CE60|nr:MULTISPECIES: bifunctional DNA-binding transcriptional regulator/O6-methylguanine-DNA methyltransferase Ada [unclassified Kluyvera]MDA8490986.1 bifunctional DNA-binding transcriptional regulator/O6-methylguanine-DNA methyltransferase Ada [Kluyvera sp. Awk 3]UAK19866.1 bifunctional DNA-binding transcriptional regulator/O6-methylguanine-DNA methyltransferase Ada [Kluyvera sp. CRP]HCR3981407.1 bifunctional DNA-binding transcriptional regulator/O6-methylguanine-DNA methyltransferase Ada [Kluyvera